MRIRWAGRWAVMGVISARAVYGQDAPRFGLETPTRARCVLPGSLNPYLASVFGRDPVAPASRLDDATPRVRVAETGTSVIRLVVSLRARREAPEVVLQTLHAPAARCGSLLTSVASALRDQLLPPSTPASELAPAARIDPSPVAVTRGAEVRVVDDGARAPTPPRASEAPPPRAGFALQLLLDGYGAYDVMPSASFGTRLGVRLRSHPRRDAGFVVGLAVRGDVPSTARYAQGTLESWALGGDLSLCGRWRFLDGCGVAHVGVSASQIAGGESRSTVRWLVGAQLGATLGLVHPLGLRASAELLVSPTRTHQEIAMEPVWTSPTLAFTGGLGVVVDLL